jgi:hypothetical protein
MCEIVMDTIGSRSVPIGELNITSISAMSIAVTTISLVVKSFFLAGERVESWDIVAMGEHSLLPFRLCRIPRKIDGASGAASRMSCRFHGNTALRLSYA